MVESNSFMAMKAPGFATRRNSDAMRPNSETVRYCATLAHHIVVEHAVWERRREDIADARSHGRGQNACADSRFDGSDILRREIERRDRSFRPDKFAQHRQKPAVAASGVEHSVSRPNADLAKRRFIFGPRALKMRVEPLAGAEIMAR